MSIILKGIDLPKEGEKITLAIFHDGDIVSYKYWLPKEAKAVQIPKGHGDIIDRNQVFTYSHRDVQNLEEVPVILKGEEW